MTEEDIARDRKACDPGGNEYFVGDASRRWPAALDEVDRLREEVARLQGDRCDVCDEDGLIYVDDANPTGHERPESCPSCGGTRSGYASQLRSDLAEALGLLDTFDFGNPDWQERLAALKAKAAAP